MSLLFGPFDLFMAMGLGGAVYGALNLFTRPNRRDKDTLFAAAVLFCFLLPLIDHLVKPVPALRWLQLPLLSVTRNGYYLTGPLLWLYALTLIQKDTPRFRTLLAHGLPFLFWITLGVIVQERLLPPPPDPFLFPRQLQGAPTIRLFPHLRDLGAVFSFLVYGAAILIGLAEHAKKARGYYSTSHARNTLSWLRLLTLVMMAINAAVGVLMMTGFRGRAPTGPLISPIRAVPAVLFIFYFAFFSKEQRIPEDTKADFDPEKYKKSALDDGAMERIYGDLLRLMQERKPYLDPELTLDDLASLTGETKHRLSQTINIKTGGNFYNFINTFRIEEFREALRTKRFPNYTLMAVAFECGFRTSSAFYSLFKKITGLTPREYSASLNAGEN